MADPLRSPMPWSIGITLVILIATLWCGHIAAVVPEPYLDEVFHIGQAQAYLRHRWDIWDPKITTPPGLYLVSFALISLNLAPRFGHLYAAFSTEVSALRLTNYAGSWFLAVMIRSLLLLNIKEQDGTCEGEHASNVRCNSCPTWCVWELVHTTMNVYLFPPLFFFYGLYYTDVLSALSVLLTYRCYLKRQYDLVILAGLVSLLFRQTNIFWVSVFMGGLALCRNIPKGRSEIEFPSHPTFYDVIGGSWQHAAAYDPLISQACFEDYIKTGISYAIAGLANFRVAVWPLSPHIVILCAFWQFVVWNGGVVLGDKENHVASIHLTQMIYIWPYFAFFSWPLLYPQYFPETVRPLSRSDRYPRKAIICITMAVMLVVVRYNTIVHPFTLADNRHYMFYVFRILLRHPSIKYFAVPIYIACAWGTLAALGGLPSARQATQQEAGLKKTNMPREESSPSSPQLDSSPMNRSESQESSTSSSQPPGYSPNKEEEPQQNGIPPKLPKGKTKQDWGHRASFVLVWLLATALSVVTTPLVEPRYLIVPWLIWRLHIASPRPVRDSAPAEGLNRSGKGVSEALKAVFKAIFYDQHDHRLWLETLWFLTINLATGYMFLYRGFTWPQEPGKVQRFMW